MATDPAFAATPNNGSALLGAAETNLQVPTTTSVILTAVEATAAALTATTVAGVVYLFLYDGTTYHLYDTVAVPLNTTASSTSAGFRARIPYTNLVIKSGWSLRASQSIAGNASVLKVSAFGGDF